MWIVVVYITIGVISGASLSGGRGDSLTSLGKSQVDTDAAIKRLSKVFGISSLPIHRHHRSPPQYMVELYNTVAYSDGVTKTSSPFDADVVRGFPDRASRHQMHFYFNVSYIESTESIMEAEFRIFQLRARPNGAKRLPGHLILLSVYEVLDENQIYSSAGARLLEQRRVSAHAHGWHVFRVGKLLKRWIEHPETNKGFIVTARNMVGNHVNGTWVRFAQRSEHHDSKQPVLVAYTQDNITRPTYIEPSESDLLTDYKEAQEKIRLQRRKLTLNFLNEGSRAAAKTRKSHPNRGYVDPKLHAQLEQANSENRRSKRSTRRAGRSTNYYRRGGNRRKWCSKKSLYVNFDEIGWSGWIISPKGYNAFQCKGECPFPLGQHQKPTNHATVQSIIHALGVAKDVETPCCVPNKLYSISLLYFDDDDNVILKQYDDMVAASCGCH